MNSPWINSFSLEYILNLRSESEDSCFNLRTPMFMTCVGHRDQIMLQTAALQPHWHHRPGSSYEQWCWVSKERVSKAHTLMHRRVSSQPIMKKDMPMDSSSSLLRGLDLTSCIKKNTLKAHSNSRTTVSCINIALIFQHIKTIRLRFHGFPALWGHPCWFLLQLPYFRPEASGVCVVSLWTLSSL